MTSTHPPSRNPPTQNLTPARGRAHTRAEHTSHLPPARPPMCSRALVCLPACRVVVSSRCSIVLIRTDADDDDDNEQQQQRATGARKAFTFCVSRLYHHLRSGLVKRAVASMCILCWKKKEETLTPSMGGRLHACGDQGDHDMPSFFVRLGAWRGTRQE